VPGVAGAAFAVRASAGLFTEDRVQEDEPFAATERSVSAAIVEVLVRITAACDAGFTRKGVKSVILKNCAILIALLLPLTFSEKTEASDFKHKAGVYSATQTAKTVEGKVVGVHDGDTITILDSENVQHKIRLNGIDAPELKQDFGNRSKQNLSDLVFGKNVKVKIDKKDRYGREVGVVLVDGKDANLEQVRAGFAWHYKKYASEQTEFDQKKYSEAETTARNSRRGLWFDANPTAPWDYRNPASSSASNRDSSINGGRARAGIVTASNGEGKGGKFEGGSGTPGRTYTRGSRGGCYYINSKGNKTYVDRSLCN
jgi:endonuclease YncB( thermonuclease family)